MKVFVEKTLIACGCAQCPHSFALSDSNNVIAFSSSSNVCLIRLSKNQGKGVIFSTTAAHSKPVICVKFVTIVDDFIQDNHFGEFLTTSAVDGTVFVWKLDGKNPENCLIKIASSEQHRGSATFCCGLFVQSEKCLTVVSCGSDNRIIISRFDFTSYSDYEFQPSLKQIIGTKSFGLCADLFKIDKYSCLLLAVGNSNASIDLFLENSSSDQELNFTKTFSLTGHTDWIRAVSFSPDLFVFSDGKLLASCGQDNLVRLWQFKRVKTANMPENQQISLHSRTIDFHGTDSLEVSLEAVLSGHEDWIFTVHWDSNASGVDFDSHPTRLLTASMDKSLVVWTPDPESGTIFSVWLENVRVGDVGGQTVGYFGAQFRPNLIIGHSYFGGFHTWIGDDSEDRQWMAKSMRIGGHFGPVVDLAWNPTGNYLITCSTDQTTRIFAPYKNDTDFDYVEMARPQMHGHDMQCIAVVSR